MNIKDIESEVAKMFEVDTMGDRIVVRSDFFCSCEETSGITLCITLENDEITITDMCETYEKLLRCGIEIDSKQNEEKLGRILEYSLTQFDKETKEFFVKVGDIEDISFALIRMFQTILVAGAFDIYTK